MKLKGGVAAVAFVLITAACGSDASSPPSSSAPPASDALPLTCAEWDGLTVAERFGAIEQYMRETLKPRPEATQATDEDTVSTAIREGCGENDPLTTPRESVADLVETLGWPTR